MAHARWPGRGLKQTRGEERKDKRGGVKADREGKVQEYNKIWGRREGVFPVRMRGLDQKGARSKFWGVLWWPEVGGGQNLKRATEKEERKNKREAHEELGKG